MSGAVPTQIWWSAAEIAAVALPDMPASRQGVESLVKRVNWRSDPNHARRRSGRGGGWEYHWKLFSLAAQKKLLAEVAPTNIQPATMSRDDAWAWFDALPENVKEKAQSRLKCIQMVEALVLAGSTKFLAVGEVAKMSGVSDKTLWNWFNLIEGVRPDDRLSHLAPRHRAAVRKITTTSEFDLQFRDFLWSDYLRPAAPSFSSCYRRATRVATENGWARAPERVGPTAPPYGSEAGMNILGAIWRRLKRRGFSILICLYQMIGFELPSGHWALNRGFPQSGRTASASMVGSRLSLRSARGSAGRTKLLWGLVRKSVLSRL